MHLLCMNVWFMIDLFEHIITCIITKSEKPDILEEKSDMSLYQNPTLLAKKPT